MDRSGEEKISCLCRDSNSGSSIPSLVVILAYSCLCIGGSIIQKFSLLLIVSTLKKGEKLFSESSETVNQTAICVIILKTSNIQVNVGFSKTRLSISKGQLGNI
jgi:hypothetical protein